MDHLVLRWPISTLSAFSSAVNTINISFVDFKAMKKEEQGKLIRLIRSGVKAKPNICDFIIRLFK